MRSQYCLLNKTAYLRVTMTGFFSVIATLLWLSYFPYETSNAQTNTSVNFQGKIVRNDTGNEGLNVSTNSPSCVQAGADTCDFQIVYFDAASGGNTLGTETFLNQEIGQRDGIFNLALGTGSFTAGTESNFLDVFLDNDTVYSELRFAPGGAGSYTEVFSRMAVRAAPYALRAQEADTLGGVDSSGFVQLAPGSVQADSTTSSSIFINKTGASGNILQLQKNATDVLVLTNSGNLGIGDSSPASPLTVGNGDLFQVSSSGDLIKIRNVAYSWPSSQAGGAGYVLTNNGSGTLSWEAPGAASIADDSLDFIKFEDTLDLDASLTVNQASYAWTQAYTGTSLPGITYTASGAINSGSAAGLYLNVSNAGTTVPASLIVNAGSGDSLRINDDGTTSDSTPFVVTSSGAVGIGVSAPTATLEVKGSQSGTSADSNTIFYDSDGVVRMATNGRGQTSWYLNSGAGEVGQVSYSTPGGEPGITFRDESNVERSEIMKLSGGGLAFRAHAGSSQPPELLRIEVGGNVGIGDSSPASMLTVGNGDLFQVNSSGNIVKINNVTYSWPSAQAGASGYVLTNNGSGTLTWEAQTGGGGGVTGSGTNGYNAYWTGATSLGSEQYVSLTRGGTGTTLTASNGGIVYSNASTLAVLAGTATANRVLMSGSSTTPSWSTATYPATAGTTGTILRSDGTNWVNTTATYPTTTTANQILYSSATNVIGGITSANNSFLTTNGSGVPSFTALSSDTFSQYALLAGRSSGQTLIGSTATTSGLNIRATSGVGTTGADIVFQVGNNGATEAMRILNSGNIGIGDSSPASMLTVGNGDLFQVNSSGNIVKINNVTYSWPSAQAAGSGYVLSNNGSGTLSWVNPSGGNGSLVGGYVSYTPSVSSASTITVTETATVYNLHADSGTTGATFTTTFNITGAVETEGSILFIRSVAQKGVTGGSRRHTVEVQINGVFISDVFTINNTPADTKIETYIVVYMDGLWRVVTTPTTSDSADYAEMYLSDEDVLSAEIVAMKESAFRTVRKATASDKGRVIGIVSTNPAMMIGDEFKGQMASPVALAGRVPVRVNSEGGPIMQGDAITVSSVPGVGMKAVSAGRVVGFALEDWDGISETIMVFVDNSWYDPGVIENAAYTQLLEDYENGLLGGSVSANGDLSVSGDLQVEGNFIIGDGSGTLQMSGVLDVDSIISESIDVAELNALSIGVGEVSAVHGIFNSINSNVLNIGNGALVVDSTSVLINGELRLDGILSSSGGSIEVTSKLKGGNGRLEVEGTLAADKLESDSIKVKEVSLERADVADASAGVAEISAGEQTVTIETSAVLSDSLVFVTLKSELNEATIFIAEQEEGSFIVKLSNIQEEDVEFNWLIVK